MIYNLCCGTAYWNGIKRGCRESCLTRQGAVFECSCPGPYCDEHCDGRWNFNGEMLTGEEMRRRAGFTGDPNKPDLQTWAGLVPWETVFETGEDCITRPVRTVLQDGTVTELS